MKPFIPTPGDSPASGSVRVPVPVPPNVPVASRLPGRLVLSALAAWTTCALAASPAGPSLLPSLSDESCSLQAREDTAAIPGLPPDQLITCGGRASGSRVTVRFYARPDRAFAASVAEAYEASRAATLNRPRMTCQAPREVRLADAQVLALPCRLTNGGWPHLVVLLADHGSSKGLLQIAEGPPALLPTLVSAAVSNAVPGGAGVADTGSAGLRALARNDYLTALQTVFGGPVPLASASELTGFQTLVRDARTANSQARYRDAEALFRRALDLQSRLLAPTDIAIAETLMELALNVSNQGRDEEALALFRRAEPVIQVSPNAADRARFASYQGYHAANFRRYDEALAFAGGAVGQWRAVVGGANLNFATLGETGSEVDPRASEKGELALALNLQANMALRVEELGLAEAAAVESLQWLSTTRGLPRWWRADVLLTLGKISSASGRLSAAERYLNTALAEQRLVTGDGARTIPILAALGKAYQVEGMNTSAIITYREIFRIIKSLPPTAEAWIAKEELVAFGLAVTAYAQTLTDEGQKQGLYTEAFDAFQLVRPPVVEQTVARASARLAVDNPELAALVDALQAAERSRDAAQLELSFENALPDDQRSRLIEDRLVGQQKAAQAEMDRLRAQITQKHPRYVALSTPKPLELLALRQRLAAREAVVAFLLGEQTSFVQLVRREGIFIGRIDQGSEALAETVAALRRSLDVQGGSLNEFDLGLASQLQQSLLGPVAEQLRDIDHLVVVPAGPLASLPFALLVEGQTRPGDYVGARWLARRMALSQAPSLRSFLALRTTAPARPPTRSLLAFGAPLLTGAPGESRGSATSPVTGSATGSAPTGLSALATSCRVEGPASAELLRALAPLPETADEVATVGRIMAASGRAVRVHTGAQATETRLRSEPLSEYRVLYFATHGLLPGELRCQAEPGLVLTPPAQASGRADDGLLEASEIAGLRLNADLVVLSACNTAGSAGRFGGDALSGLAESFFYAGARGLVASHWQVPSAATARLMTGLFQSLGPELAGGSAASLRQSQQALMNQAATAHPFFWAAFVVVGDGQADSRLPLARGGRL